MQAHQKPTVLCIAGLDPSGGAGIQADIQTASALGCHCLPIISTLTVQDSGKLYSQQPVNQDLVCEQLDRLFSDFSIQAVKIGALGTAEFSNKIAQKLEALESVPIVIDPVLSAGGGGELADSRLRNSLINDLFPQATLITPNRPEALKLAESQSLEDAIPRLFEKGVKSLLVTGGHEEGDHLINRLFDHSTGSSVPAREWELPRSQGNFRGTGCTFASAIASLLARHFLSTSTSTTISAPLSIQVIADAIEEAQHFMHQSIVNSYRMASGTQVPDRLAPLSMPRDIPYEL